MPLAQRALMAAAGVSAGGANWWESGGATGAVAVYQPKGAASLAASYTDLSGNGNDAAPGTAPTWDATNGWTFTNINQFLLTGIVPANGYSLFCQFTNLVGEAVAGYVKTNASLYLRPNRAGGFLEYGSGGSKFAGGQAITSGNVSVCGQTGYKNGVVAVTAIPAWAASADYGITINKVVTTGGTAIFTGTSYIQALAIYNNTLDATKTAAVAAAMAAL